MDLATKLITEAISELAARCATVEPEKEPRLNIVLTDGDSMIVTRWHNSLDYLERNGLHDCDICGIPHVHHVKGTNYRSVVVASEPLSDERWVEVPDESAIRIDSDARAVLSPIGESTATL